MQPTKSKGTRYQPKGLYIAATVLLAISTFYGVGEQFAEDWFNRLNDGLNASSPVQWRDRETALSEAKRTKKPILYAFLTRHDTASLQMYGDGFRDQKIADLINSSFIPVRVDYNRHENSNGQPGKSKLHDQYGYTSTCELLVVPAHMTDLSTVDIESTGNIGEAGIENTAGLEAGDRYNWNYNARYRNTNYRSDGNCGNPNSPKFIGYTNKRDLTEYLYFAQHWHQLPPTKGKVAWLPVSVASAPLSSKPRLLVFVDNVGGSNDSLRFDIFWNNKDYTLINKEYQPVLLEFHHNDAEFNKPLEVLKAKYGITSLPALVIESPKMDTPQIQFGHSNSSTTHDFLVHGVLKNEVKTSETKTRVKAK